MTSPEKKKQIIASRLREARKLSGLSQGQVAKELDVHRPTVSQIEAGERNVTADEIAQFAKLYDVSVAWLVGEGAEKLDPHDDQVQLAARELQKLDPQDLERLLSALGAMRKGKKGDSK